MRILVGRSIVPTAAKRSALLRRVISSTLPFDGLSASRMRRPRPSIWKWPVSSSAADQCHGQLYSATIVNVVSRPLEKVLVAQNHCQGDATVSMRAAADASDPEPYVVSDNFQV